MIKKLPIVIKDAEIVSECWTFERMAILQTSPYATDWLASHMNIFMTDSFYTYFGENFHMYRPQYYEDILNQKKINIFQIPDSQILDEIKQKIDSGDYVVICTMLGYNSENNPYFHEILIYGYDDDNKCFFTTLMENRIFTESTFPYESVSNAFPLVKKHLSTDIKQFIDLSTNYLPPFITLSLKKEYNTDNSLYMAIDKLNKEISGKQTMDAGITDSMNSYGGPTVYTGIACLVGLNNLLNRICQNAPLDEQRNGLVNVIKKLHEHRRLILLSMKYIKDKLLLESKNIFNYETCCERVQKWYLMAMKYEITKDKSLLFHIICEIWPAFNEERMVLRDFKQEYTEALEIMWQKGLIP